MICIDYIKLGALPKTTEDRIKVFSVRLNDSPKPVK